MTEYCEKCRMHIVDAHDPSTRCPVDGCQFNVGEGKDQAFRIVGEIAKLSLQPGDLLVIKVDDLITDQMANSLRGQFDSVVPDGVKAVVIDRATSLSIISTKSDAGVAVQ